MQRRSQIYPKWCAGGSLGDARGLPGASRGALRAGFQTQLKMHEKNDEFWKAPGTSWEAPRDPEGLPKSTKNRFFAAKGRSKHHVLSIFVQMTVLHVVFRDFALILREESMKKQWKKQCIFSQLRMFFEHGDPHETSYFTMRKPLIQFLDFCVFS